MQTSIITWATIHLYGDLWWQSHKMRKLLFVDGEKWDIPHTDVAEWDQYDTPSTIYCITHIGDKAIASSRILPCSLRHGNWSYMLRDAIAGKIEGIPSNILTEAPQEFEAWEATRFCVDPKLDADMRNAALRENATQLIKAARIAGASQLYSVMHPGFIRWLRNIPLPAERLGPTTSTPDGSKICAIRMSSK